KAGKSRKPEAVIPAPTHSEGCQPAVPSAMSTIATPANTTAYRSLVSNQPTRGSWCDRCQPQPQPCMTYLWAYQAKASIPARVIRNTTVLIAMCMAGVTDG